MYTEYATYVNRKLKLTKSGAEARLGTTLMKYFDAENIDSTIQEVTDKIYEHLMTFPSWNEIEYLIESYDFYKDRMVDILVNQLRYAIRSAGDMIGDQVIYSERTVQLIGEKQRSEMMLSSSVYKMISATFRYHYDYEIKDLAEAWRLTL